MDVSDMSSRDINYDDLIAYMKRIDEIYGLDSKHLYAERDEFELEKISGAYVVDQDLDPSSLKDWNLIISAKQPSIWIDASQKVSIYIKSAISKKDAFPDIVYVPSDDEVTTISGAIAITYWSGYHIHNTEIDDHIATIERVINSLRVFQEAMKSIPEDIKNFMYGDVGSIIYPSINSYNEISNKSIDYFIERCEKLLVKRRSRGRPSRVYIKECFELIVRSWELIAGTDMSRNFKLEKSVKLPTNPGMGFVFDILRLVDNNISEKDFETAGSWFINKKIYMYDN